MSEMPRSAEHLLADEGVFKGHEGLRRLEAASEFWERQPYGTRLYFGGGGLDYLHRSVLRAAISALDKAATLKTELAKLRQHAEAMADDLDRFAAQPDCDGQLYGPMPSLIAYRADFPEKWS